MLRFKQFENIFLPKEVDSREEGRKRLLEKEVEKESKRYIQIKNKSSYLNLLDAVVEDIFFIWDRYNSDDREGIEHGMEGSGNGKWEHVFNYNNDKFLDHVKMFLEKIECAYSFPRRGKLVLEGFTS